VNVGLGLFGILWYNINSRRSEMGLRRAVGASGNGITLQLIGEAIFMATLALILGTLLAIQFPLLRVFDLYPGIYLMSILISVLFIYLLVILCALYPGKQAANLLPAVVLHED
jgi:putative ABC transport system permease protein